MSKETKENWRKEQARREIGVTEISRSAAVFLSAMFLGVICLVPAVQHGIGLRQELRGEEPGLSSCRQFDGVGATMGRKWREADTFLQRFVDPNAALLERIIAFQEELDEACFVRRLTASPVQAVMCRLGVGNETALVGRGGWLFYEPDVRHVTGPGFLDPRQLEKRSRSGNEFTAAPQPDPVEAIVHFRDQLRERNIELIVMPVPVKPSIHPGQFSSSLRGYSTAVRNASWPEFLETLEEEDIRVFDAAPILVRAREEAGAAYLATDTHWRPEAMQRVADSLALFLEQRIPLSAAFTGDTRYAREATPVANMGDISRMLELAEDDADLFPREEVVVERVKEPDGSSWRNRADAEILLLGDSFANVFSLPGMGWGEGAGLAEQLAFELQRPVERIVRNDAGAHATRDLLARDLARGRDRLKGKTVVIWQFATRELSQGKWRLVELTGPEHRPDAGTAVSLPPGGLRVTGRISAVSERPEKDASYRDFVMKFYVEDIRDAESRPVGEGDGVVHVLSMKDRKFLPPASVREGERLSLRLRNWEDVEEQYGSLKTGSLDDIMLEIEKTLYWGE
ncbi:MAG: hypothetical protein HQ559_02765 [Lentisphaerae bacterium]|nr:hypothetical protein [Lentisphaerota bacterium]